MEKEYALYKGDKILSIGRIDEIAKEMKIKKETVYFYGSTAYTKRTSDNGRRLVKLDDEEEI